MKKKLIIALMSATLIGASVLSVNAYQIGGGVHGTTGNISADGYLYYYSSTSYGSEAIASSTPESLSTTASINGDLTIGSTILRDVVVGTDTKSKSNDYIESTGQWETNITHVNATANAKANASNISGGSGSFYVKARGAEAWNSGYSG